MSWRIVVLILLGVPLMAATGSDDPPDLSALLPGEVLGWRPGGDDEVFDRDNLFDLIDGGAEVYRALNVRRVVSRQYVKPGAPDIIADVFDMGSARDAFGAYHHDMREGKDAGVGRESELLGCNLSFWKDRYFVSVVPLDITEESGRAVLELSRKVAGAIRGEGEKPDLVALLPAGDLVASQVHYFHDKTLLDRHIALGKENVLGLSGETEGVLARYRRAPAALLLIRYGSSGKALAARAGFLRRLISAGDEEGTGRTRTGQWAGARAEGTLLSIVTDASSRERVRTLLEEVDRKRLEKERLKGEDGWKNPEKD